MITHWHYYQNLSLPNKQKRVVNLTLQLFQVIYNMKLLEIWIPQKSRFFPTLQNATKWESKNEITGITQPSRLFYMLQHRQFQVGCLFGLNPWTNRQTKQTSGILLQYRWLRTLWISNLAIKFANQCQKQIETKKYGHFASIVIEINRSKLIILHQNLDVNESQNSKTSRNRSFCITDHCAKW